MNKYWYTSDSHRLYESREEAIEAAKKRCYQRQSDIEIYETSKIAVAKFPLPDIQVVDLTSETPAPAAT